MERSLNGEYYFRINDRNGLIEKIKETGSKQNDLDFEIGNYYASLDEAEEALNY